MGEAIAPVTARLALTVLCGVVTMYAHDAHAGNPLRCGGTYTVAERWVAADVDNGPYSCGDLLAICAAGECHVLEVRDSGPLSRYCVMGADGCEPILVDIPQHVWWGGDALSMPARVVSVTAARERMEVER